MPDREIVRTVIHNGDESRRKIYHLYKAFALVLVVSLGALTFNSCVVPGRTNGDEDPRPTYSLPPYLLTPLRPDSVWCDDDCDGITELVSYEECDNIDCDDC